MDPIKEKRSKSEFLPSYPWRCSLRIKTITKLDYVIYKKQASIRRKHY